MILRIYSIFDAVSQAYMQPFYCINEQVAQRHFRNLANDDQSNIGRNPKDFILFYLGTFDDSTAEIVNETPVKHLGLAISYKDTNA